MYIYVYVHYLLWTKAQIKTFKAKRNFLLVKNQIVLQKQSFCFPIFLFKVCLTLLIFINDL